MEIKPVTIVVLALAVLVFSCFWLFNRRSGSPNLASASQSGGPSLYELIKAQVESEPGKPLDTEKLPSTYMPEDNSIKFAPGGLDHLMGGNNDASQDIQQVLSIIKKVEADGIKDWQTLEKKIKGIQAISAIDPVMEKVSQSGISYDTVDLFWQVALQSRNYEAVKWGIALGSLNATEQKAKSLMVFARHPEFTLYASHALLLAAQEQSHFKRYLVQLLPVSEQWGVISLVDFITKDSELIADYDVQRDVLNYGMENVGFIPMEIAFTIAQHIDLPYWFRQAGSDERIYRNLYFLMETLMFEPAPLGGLMDLEKPRDILSQYLAMLINHKSDIYQLGAFRSINLYLADEATTLPERESLRHQAQSLLDKHFSVETLRQGLTQPESRDIALTLMEERQIKELLPDVIHLFKTAPDYRFAMTLRKLGGPEELRFLLGRLPELVDFQKRQAQPFSAMNVMPSPEFQNGFLYSEIVLAMGKLGTPEAIAEIKRAANDFDPYIRSAACEAVLELPKEKIDEELKSIIRKRQSEELEYLKKSAQQAARHAGL